MSKEPKTIQATPRRTIFDVKLKTGKIRHMCGSPRSKHDMGIYDTLPLMGDGICAAVPERSSLSVILILIIDKYISSNGYFFIHYGYEYDYSGDTHCQCIPAIAEPAMLKTGANCVAQSNGSVSDDGGDTHCQCIPAIFWRRSYSMRITSTFLDCGIPHNNDCGIQSCVMRNSIVCYVAIP